MDDDDPTTADLFIAAVLKVAGPDGLAKMRAIAGGTQITVGIHAVEGSVVVRALGLEDARRVCEELRVFNVEGRPTAIPTFYFPRCFSATLEQRRVRVVKLRLEGKTKRDIAVELGVSDRTVQLDIRRLEADGRLPLSLPSFHPQVRALLLPPNPRCEVVELSDHSANLGGMVPPSADEVP